MKEHKDMIYNAHAILRDYWSYEEIFNMPMGDVRSEVDFFLPKLKEIAQRQESDRLKNELAGKQNMRPPGMRGG